MTPREILLEKRSDYMRAKNPYPVAARVGLKIYNDLPAQFRSRIFGMDIILDRTLEGMDVVFIEKGNYSR